MKIKFFFIIILCLIMSTYTFITVHKGKIITDEDNKCLITNDDINWHNITNSNMLFFGLIKYNCTKGNGVLISKHSCLDCQIYCAQNDNMIGCQHYILPIIVGTLFGTLMFIILLLTIFCYKKIMNILTQREEKNNSILDGDNTNDVLLNESKNKYPQTHVSRRSSVASAYSLTAMTLLLCSIPTQGCDETLFITSDSKVCTISECYNMLTYSFDLAIGSTVCFQTQDKQMVKMSLNSLLMYYRYAAIYRTTDYTINSESYSRCKQAGECDKEHCHDGSIGNLFGNDTTYSYTCLHEGLGCDFMCFHKYACTWIRWKINTKGPIATVYELEYSLWHSSINVESYNTVQTIQLNANNPKGHINLRNNNNIKSIPISISSVITENDNYNKDLLIYQGNPYYVDASDLDLPQTGRIGDLQIELLSDKKILALNSVYCSVSGCKPICKTTQSSLSRVLRNKLRTNTLNLKIENINLYDATVSRNIMGSIKLNLGNVNFKNLYLEQASCKIDILDVFGCVGCNEPTYIVLHAYNIKQPGIVSFTSNCSFTNSFVSCNNIAYKLVLNDDNNYCYIYIPVFNQTLFVNIKRNFIGNLTIEAYKYGQNVDLSYTLSSLIKNDNFITSVYSSFLFFSGITISSILIMKIIVECISIYHIKKEQENLEKV